MANDRSVMDGFDYSKVSEKDLVEASSLPTTTTGRIVSGAAMMAGQLKIFNAETRVSSRATSGSIELMREDGSPVDTMGDLFPLIEQARSIADAAGLTQAEPRVRVVTQGGEQILGLRLTW